MSDDAEMMDRHARLLARIAEQGAAAADLLLERIAAAETADEAAQAALALGRTHRSIRQSIALEAKLRRLARREARAEAGAAREAADTAHKRHKARVRARLERLIKTEGDEAAEAELEETLDLLLDEDAFSDDFLQIPAEAHIARLCRELGLTPPDPEPPPNAASEPQPRAPAAEAEAPPGARPDVQPPPPEPPAAPPDDGHWRPSG